MTKDYTRVDAERLAAEIRKELPDAKVWDCRDFGFAVDVMLGDRTCVACQPQIDSIDQPGLFFTAIEIKKLLTDAL